MIIPDIHFSTESVPSCPDKISINVPLRYGVIKEVAAETKVYNANAITAPLFFLMMLKSILSTVNPPPQKYG